MFTPAPSFFVGTVFEISVHPSWSNATQFFARVRGEAERGERNSSGRKSWTKPTCRSVDFGRRGRGSSRLFVRATTKRCPSPLFSSRSRPRTRLPAWRAKLRPRFASTVPPRAIGRAVSRSSPLSSWVFFAGASVSEQQRRRRPTPIHRLKARRPRPNEKRRDFRKGSA